MKGMKQKILVMYGGVCPEHEVSIITALQVMEALKGGGFEVLPLYISKKGEWCWGDKRFLKPKLYKNLNEVVKLSKRVIVSPDSNWGILSKGWLGFGAMEEKVDVVFPVFHGRLGEDGAIQGMLEHADLPYVGCGVLAGSVGIDKYVAKKMAESLGILVTEDKLVSSGEWKKNKKKVLNEVEKLKLPVFVKPVGLGSSIGMTKVKKISELEDALEVAFCYDTRVLVEEGVEELKEVNISVLGNNPYQVSVTEEPVLESEILSFENKYEGDSGKGKGMAGAKRFLPARIDRKTQKKIEKMTIDFFRAIGGKGIARIDFMISKDKKVYFNEINTMPGSLAFYLWEKSGIPFKRLVRQLVELAIESWTEKKRLTTTFENNILAGFSRKGLKGGKV